MCRVGRVGHADDVRVGDRSIVLARDVDGILVDLDSPLDGLIVAVPTRRVADSGEGLHDISIHVRGSDLHRRAPGSAVRPLCNTLDQRNAGPLRSDARQFKERRRGR